MKAAAMRAGVRTWKLTIEYDGSRYSGWQVQSNARTVQGELIRAAEDFFRCEVDTQGAGRTDAGVHARGQVMHLRARGNVPAAVILKELNARLPADIVVLAVEAAADRFHARHDAVSRAYVYQISTRKSAFAKKYVWWIKDPLDVGAMARAARMIEGRHDFRCFRDEDATRRDESTVVVVERALVEREGDLILFRIEASHFLWKMVRRLTGAVVRVGLGGLAMEDFGRLLEARCDARLPVAEWTAPGAGLFLERVRYRGDPAGP